MDRNKKIIRTSILGIAVNLVLVAFKAFVGLLANSIAVILDAINNLSDAMSSLITIVGTKLSAKRPDKKHPFGYGRIEYITSAVIAVIVLFAGVTSIKESAIKIFSPEPTDYKIYSIIIIAVAVVVKFVMGTYVKGVGKKISSQSLIASGSDAFFDAILSLGTLAGAAASMIWGLNLEGYIGVLISAIIIKAGVEMLIETLSGIIGDRPDSELTAQMRETVCSYPEVRGAYDLTLHNYGPSKQIATVHIEVDDGMTAKRLHKLTRAIQNDVYQKFGIILTVGVYASNTSGEHAEIRSIVEREVKKHPEVLQMHGFYIDEETRHVSFDIVVDFEADANAVCCEIIKNLSAAVPDYKIDVILDTDFSD